MTRAKISGGIVCVALVAAYMLASTVLYYQSQRFAPSTVLQLHEGMKYGEMVAVMGEPDRMYMSIGSAGESLIFCEWGKEGGDVGVLVALNNGKVFRIAIKGIIKERPWR